MKEIELANGEIAIIDEEDWLLVAQYKWRLLEKRYTKYAQANIKKNGKWRTMRMHRLIMNCPRNIQIDHIDHDGLNNRKSNLRFATNQQNNFNRKGYDTSSKYKGVTWRTKLKKWEAQIQTKGKSKYLGYYANENDAARAYNKMAVQVFGEYAYVNAIE